MSRIGKFPITVPSGVEETITDQNVAVTGPKGALDLDAGPPEGVFYSRMSASSHTRGHVASKDYTRSVLSWLESHGRVVVNGRRVVEMEMSKIDQHTALRAFGFDVPSTVAVIGRHDLKARARAMAPPFLTKHNQGGKGLGVRRFDCLEDLDDTSTGPNTSIRATGSRCCRNTYIQPGITSHGSRSSVASSSTPLPPTPAPGSNSAPPTNATKPARV